eukprot:1152719-Pelagomonas_calceolata.AAC.1
MEEATLADGFAADSQEPPAHRESTCTYQYPVGRGNSPYINLGKGDTLAQKSRESPPPRSYKTENTNGDLEGYWKHPAPGTGSEKYLCLQTLCYDSTPSGYAQCTGPTNTQKDACTQGLVLRQKFQGSAEMRLKRLKSG